MVKPGSMYKISALLILLISFTCAFSQSAGFDQLFNSENRTEDNLIDQIKGYIERNRADSLSLLCSDSMKTKVTAQELGSRVNLLFELIAQNTVKKFKSLEQNSSSSSSTTITSGVMKETRAYTYTYVPPFFGQNTNKLLMTNAGYSVNIEISRSGNNWYLNSLVVTPNYLSQDDNINEFVTNLFSGNDTCIVQFRTVTPNKNLYGYLEISSNKQMFVTWFKNLRYLKMNEFVKPTSEGTKTLSILFYSKKKTQKKFMDLFETPMALEVVFYDDNSNQCFISLGEKYGFYKLSDTSPIKKYIYKEFQDIK